MGLGLFILMYQSFLCVVFLCDAGWRGLADPTGDWRAAVDSAAGLQGLE